MCKSTAMPAGPGGKPPPINGPGSLIQGSPQPQRAAPQLTGYGPFGNPLFGAGYSGAPIPGYGGAQPPMAAPAAPAAPRPAASAPRPVAAQPKAAPAPQVRTQVVTGGKDLYRQALASELTKRGNLKTPYVNGVWP